MITVRSCICTFLLGMFTLAAGPALAMAAAEDVVRATTDQTVARLRAQKPDLK